MSQQKAPTTGRRRKQSTYKMDTPQLFRSRSISSAIKPALKMAFVIHLLANHWINTSIVYEPSLLGKSVDPAIYIHLQQQCWNFIIVLCLGEPEPAVCFSYFPSQLIIICSLNEWNITLVGVEMKTGSNSYGERLKFDPTSAGMSVRHSSKSSGVWNFSICEFIIIHHYRQKTVLRQQQSIT